MQIALRHGLPFVQVTIRANQQVLRLDNVLLDTGSAATVFDSDALAGIGVELQLEDEIVYMVGIGGTEPVVEKWVSAVEVDALVASPFLIQLGSLDYGMPLDGILGIDFLVQTGAKIDLQRLEVTR